MRARLRLGTLAAGTLLDDDSDNDSPVIFPAEVIDESTEGTTAIVEQASALVPVLDSDDKVSTCSPE